MPAAWHFEATLADGRTVREFDLAHGTDSPWLALMEMARRAGGMKSLALCGATARIVLPPSPYFVHVKRARCELPEGVVSRTEYALGWMDAPDGSVALLWGQPDGSATIERRPEAGKLTGYAIAGTGVSVAG